MQFVWFILLDLFLVAASTLYYFGDVGHSVIMIFIFSKSVIRSVPGVSKGLLN